jgi:uncharacterized protein DUF6982/PilZ domain-containing protein
MPQGHATALETQLAGMLRAYRRFPTSELAGLRTTRVKWGPEVSVINLSVGGVRFEGPGELATGSTVVLEFSGPTKTVLRTARVMRCQSYAVESTARTDAACAFRRPFPVDDFAGEPLPEQRLTVTVSDNERTWQQVVGKYRDGRLIRGYTNDFNPKKPYLHISPTPYAEASQFVSMINLDALFFGRDTRRDPSDVDLDGPDVVPAEGRRVAVPLANGTEMIGSARSYSRNGAGFFVESLDEQSGTLRVFVTAGGVRSVRFV